MTKEGVLRESYLYRGKRHDQEIWSVLAPDWRAGRQAAAKPLITRRSGRGTMPGAVPPATPRPRAPGGAPGAERARAQEAFLRAELPGGVGDRP